MKNEAETSAEKAAGLTVPDECPHLIWFDDQDCKPLMFSGSGARAAALHKFKEVSLAWNAHLFVRVANNCRDDRFTAFNAFNARLATPADAPVAEPVALTEDTLYLIRRHLANQHSYSHKEFCTKLADIIATRPPAPEEGKDAALNREVVGPAVVEFFSAIQEGSSYAFDCHDARDVDLLIDAIDAAMAQGEQ